MSEQAAITIDLTKPGCSGFQSSFRTGEEAGFNVRSDGVLVTAIYTPPGIEPPLDRLRRLDAIGVAKLIEQTMECRRAFEAAARAAERLALVMSQEVAAE